MLSDIESAYKTYGEYTLQRWYFIESVMRGAEVMTLAQSFTGLGNELGEKAPSQEKIDLMKQALLEVVAACMRRAHRWHRALRGTLRPAALDEREAFASDG